jgi:curli production assembly/transport component CsgG
VGLDNLIKERQLIRNQREVYEGKDARPLKPMTVAGVMIEGGIIGYDSNIRSGGNGARFLGIGGSQQYRVDEIVISMRLISVNSGEVLLTTAVSKTIFSTQHNVGMLRFVDAGTKALELENGMALNEPTTYAVRVAIEQAVYDMIIEGEKKGIWRFKKPGPVARPEEVKVESKKEDVKVEEKKDVVVQPQTKSETKTEAVPSTPAEVKKEQPKESVDLFGTQVLKEDAYVYKEANEKSQRTWQLKKGTELTIISPGPEGWHLVRDAEKRKGFVKQDVLVNKPQ